MTIRQTVFVWRKPLVLLGAQLVVLAHLARQDVLYAVAIAVFLLMAWSAYPMAGSQKGYPSRGALHAIVGLSVLGLVVLSTLLVLSP